MARPLAVGLIVSAAVVCAPSTGFSEAPPELRVTFAKPAATGAQTARVRPQDVALPAPLDGARLAQVKRRALVALGGAASTNGLAAPLTVDAGHFSVTAGAVSATVMATYVDMAMINGAMKMWIMGHLQAGYTNQDGNVSFTVNGLASSQLLVLDCSFASINPIDRVDIEIDAGNKTVHTDSLTLDAGHVLYAFKAPAAGMSVYLTPRYSQSTYYAIWGGCTLHPTS